MTAFGRDDNKGGGVKTPPYGVGRGEVEDGNTDRRVARRSVHTSDTYAPSILRIF